MTDYSEEQSNEIEALKSIYFDEYEDLDPPTTHFRILVKPEEDIDDTSPFYATCYLTVSYTPTYPDILPELTITDPENLTEEEIEDLSSKMMVEAENNIGMVMVFTLVAFLKESLTDLITNKAHKKKQIEEAVLRKQEEEEMKRYEGTKVTKESFLAWKVKFDFEVAELERIKKAKEDGAMGISAGKSAALAKEIKLRLTGKQLFEKDKNLANSDVAFAADGENEVSVDVALFEKEFDDLDLEGISDDDDDDDDNEVLKNLADSDDDN